MSGIGAGAPNALARVASAGLGAGVRGGIEGAGLAEDGNRLNAAARAAAPAAALGMAGAAAPAAANAVKNLFKGGPPGPLAPAMATVGTGAQPSAREVARGAQAARSAGTAATVHDQSALGGQAPPQPPPAAPMANCAPASARPQQDPREAIGGARSVPRNIQLTGTRFPPRARQASSAPNLPPPEPIEFMPTALARAMHGEGSADDR
jgi:hypothetical protein